VCVSRCIFRGVGGISYACLHFYLALLINLYEFDICNVHIYIFSQVCRCCWFLIMQFSLGAGCWDCF